MAIGILAMVAVLGWRGLDSIMRSREVLTSQLEQARGMQLAFAQMQSDCDHLAGAGQDNNLLNGRINLTAETDRLTLVRLAASEQEPQQLQVVTYRLRGGVLTRRESNGTRDLAVLDTLWQAARDDTDTSSADVALMNGVDSMVMRGWTMAPERPDGRAPSRTEVSGLEVTLQMLGQDAGLSKVPCWGRMKLFSPPARQRGVAVITALLLTALAITVVASLFWQQQVQVRSMENQRLRLETQWAMRGMVDFARFWLRQDNPSQTALDGVWATPIEEARLDDYVDREKVDTEKFDATVSGRALDAQARFNITNLVAATGGINPKQVQAYQRLLSNLQLDSGLAQATADAVLRAKPKPRTRTAAAMARRPPPRPHRAAAASRWPSRRSRICWPCPATRRR